MAVSKQARMGWGGERERRMGVRDGEGKKKGGGRGERECFSNLTVWAACSESLCILHSDCVNADMRIRSCGNGGSALNFRSGMI